MNKKQRKRAKRLRKRRQRIRQANEPTGSRGDTTPPRFVESKQDDTFGKPVKAIRLKPQRPHVLTITLTAIGLIFAAIALYWNIAVPDIRYVSSLAPESMTVVESKVDAGGNFVHSVRMRPTFTNYSLKPGFIDKAEFAPQTIATVPDIKITGIDKTFIFWHQKKQIEITFLMTIPTDPLNHLNTTRELGIDQVIVTYDDTGRKINLNTNGLFGRIRFNFKEIAKIQVKDIH
jgi:hypothetical protein